MQNRKHTSSSPQARRKRSGIPCTMVLRLISCSPVNRACCHRRRRDCRSNRRRFDASIGASGPHDFAVRELARSSATRNLGHRIPRPTSVTIAIRPSCRRGTARGLDNARKDLERNKASKPSSFLLQLMAAKRRFKRPIIFISQPAAVVGH
jgi:hypothetical protein